MPLIPLEVERQTIYEVPKYGIQIRCKPDENCSFFEVKTLLLFFGFTLHHKSGKNCTFSEFIIFFYWSLHQFQKIACPQPPQNFAYATVSNA